MCQAELHEFTQRVDDVREAGIRVVALSVDGLGQDSSTPEKAREAIRRFGRQDRVKKRRTDRNQKDEHEQSDTDPFYDFHVVALLIHAV